MTTKERSDLVDDLLVQLAEAIESGPIRKGTASNAANIAVDLLQRAVPQITEADAMEVALAMKFNVKPVFAQKIKSP